MNPEFDALTAAVVPTLFPPLMRRILSRWGLESDAVQTEEIGFDRLQYERSLGHRFRSDEAAVFHYLLVGLRRGMRPRSDFDPADYLRRNPDVALAGYEPFAHYLRFGRSEGRGDTALADKEDEALAAVPSIAGMLTRHPPGSVCARVDVVIPVYGSRHLALQAIDSVLAAHVTTAYELIVVDDASSDPELRADLAALSAKGLLTLLTNERNLGFVGSANRGMALHLDRDVVLLNSDTRVFDGWLDRVMSALRSTPRTATATPLSNAATILSYPVTLQDNKCPASMDLAHLDRLCAGLGQPLVELPTGVGFCMAIRRACLREVGAFDAELFGSGYGEENDFCLRATAAGWRHVAATDVFVWHRGGGSFGAERETRIASALATLEELHPSYAAQIQSFIGRDPLHGVRAALDAARVKADPRPKILRVGSCNKAMAYSVNSLTLAMVPDIGPFYGQFKLVSQDFSLIPNLSRMNRDTSPVTLCKMMRDLAIAEVRLEASDSINPRLRNNLRIAAKIAGVVIRAGAA